MNSADSTAGAVYLNPVYGASFPDPFVLKFRGQYWGYCTGVWGDGRCFGILHSRDLVNWREVGGAMEQLPDRPPHYWAPEVFYDNGRFLLYYSAGDEARMHIRVAVANHPAGPFVDSGRRLTAEEFAIDAHVFEDDDGARYLFYATDFLDHTHIGTGTVRDRLLDSFTLARDPRPVTRARYNWQVYDPQRAEKGGVRWHTVEGPFVLKRKGRYYQMFSGGNWKNTTYGVSYATSDHIAPPGEWEQLADGGRVLPILRTLPGLVVGPGHNSAVRGPDNQQLFCVYHRWAEDGSGRVLAVDRMDWAGERLFVLGPSTTAQPVPIGPSVEGFSPTEDSEYFGPPWECSGGRWTVRDGEALQSSIDPSEARCSVGAPCYTLELSLRAADDASDRGSYGIRLYGDSGPVLQCMLAPAENRLVVSWKKARGWTGYSSALPSGFAFTAHHLMRIEVDDMHVSVALDGVAARWQGFVSAPAPRVALATSGTAAAFAGFALTIGWQDLFAGEGTDPRTRGWQIKAGGDAWRVGDGQLHYTDSGGTPAVIAKGTGLESYELVVNARLGDAAPDGCYGIYPALHSECRGPLLTLARDASNWALVSRGVAGVRVFRLPVDFDPTIYQQFRFRRREWRIAIQWAGESLGEIEAPAGPTRVGLHAHRARAAFDMVRVTSLDRKRV
jgi:GH43 family beta-xylosidase